jgi:hypothetical protein
LAASAWSCALTGRYSRVNDSGRHAVYYQEGRSRRLSAWGSNVDSTCWVRLARPGIRDWLRARYDPRQVITDPDARYFGAKLGERTLLPGDDAQLGSVTLEE